MSRLGSLSPAAIQAFFSTETEESIIILLTFVTSSGTYRIANSFTQRLSENAEDIIYGVVSRGNNYIYLPFNLTLPADSQDEDPSCSVTLYDVTRQLLPVFREIEEPPEVTLEIILASTPNTVEVSFGKFYFTGIEYDANQITGTLDVDRLSHEPFPRDVFLPSTFPGLF